MLGEDQGGQILFQTERQQGREQLLRSNPMAQMSNSSFGLPSILVGPLGAHYSSFS